MKKQAIRVIIGREVQLTAAGMLGRKFDFKPGHAFITQEWFYPGEPYKEGAWTGRLRDQWSFGTNSGSDLPLFFAGEDVEQVVIPIDPEIAMVFKGAPFKVVCLDPVLI